MEESLKFLILVIVVIAAAMTNPTKKDHLRAISEQNAVVGGILELGSTFGGVNYNNYVVASTLSIDGQKITLGLFRNVVILSDQTSK